MSTSSTAPAGDGPESPDHPDGLGEPAPVEHGSLRHRIRSKRGLAQAWRVGVFVCGLLFVALGIGLSVLPGPLTIPPVLVGLWIWSTEFAWARRLFESFHHKAKQTWAHSRRHPVSSSIVTIGGLVMAGVVFWAVGHYDLVDRGKSAVGL